MLRYVLTAVLLFASPLLAQDPVKFPRGAKASPRWKLQSTPPHRVGKTAPPSQFAVVPPKLSMWYNDQYGDCVTAQEAFAKAAWSVQCGLPELLVPDAEVKRWASKYGFLNGANLTEVMDKMKVDGFTVDGKNYKDGPYYGVDFSKEPVLQSAIYTGPVNIAIDADALPSGAGNKSGWYAVGGGRFPNTDHCVALSGYGTAEFLYQKLGVTTPTALAGKSGYLLFTWNTIGFVDHAWLMGTCVEAWVRNPTTPGQAPTPTPPDPNPPNPPTPTPGGVTITLSADLKAGTYKLVGGNSIVVDPKMTIEDLVNQLKQHRKPEAKPPEKPTDKPPTVPPTMPPPDTSARRSPRVGEKVGEESTESGEALKSDVQKILDRQKDWPKRRKPPGPWGDGVEFPKGMERFTAEKFTQALTIERGEELVYHVGIDRLIPKWRTSGGMEGISNWRSDKYRLVPTKVKEFVGPIDHVGIMLRGVRREYPDGTRFDDVLSNTETGKVFEHRSRQKSGGKWENSVLYRDRSERPAGYGGLGQSCISCHKDAGKPTAGYGSALIPGDDTVFSDPMPWHILRR